MSHKIATCDERAAMVAERQHGIVAARQLHALGLNRAAVSYRCRTGHLHRIHQGVYAVGHRAISFQGRCMAAVLACGGRAGVVRGEGDAAGGATVLNYWGAAISHRSAAAIWQLFCETDGPVDVSVPSDAGRARRRGIRVHRCSSLLPAAVTLRSGIPITTPKRTLADLDRASAARRPWALSPKQLRRVIRQAEVLGLPLGDNVASDRTRSDLERDFLVLCRRHRLPIPEVNVPVGEDLVDFLWYRPRLIVETDSYLYHRGRAAFQDDRERDLRLRAKGFDVMRVSEKQVDEEPERVAGVLARALRVGADGGQGR
jgi:very-short-patch-repair endonuclease